MSIRPVCSGLAVVFAATAFSVRVEAQERFFAGSVAGISTLSAGSTATVQPPRVESSSYSAKNGPAVNAFFGLHLNDYLSIQADYFWNRNDLYLSSVSSSSYYEQQRSSSQQTVLGELLLYFRNRASWVRPYLTVGTGVTHLTSDETGSAIQGGTVALPPQRFSANEATLHVAVGIDLKIRSGWAFRYSFAETISGNPISRQLSPPASGNLKNFRNLFGFVKYF